MKIRFFKFVVGKNNNLNSKLLQTLSVPLAVLIFFADFPSESEDFFPSDDVSEGSGKVLMSLFSSALSSCVFFHFFLCELNIWLS